MEEELAAISVRFGVETNPFLAKDLEATVFTLPADQIIVIVGHVPAIDAGEFLFLSGFTYFVGAWVEFERVCRRRVEIAEKSNRPIVGGRLIDGLAKLNLISPTEVQPLRELARHRNHLIHGDSTEIPKKQTIDWLVDLTNRVRAAKMG